MRKLIINADDYGLSNKFNKGILELVGKGIATSTTVMVNKAFVKPSELLMHENISIGLHLVLLLESTKKDIEDQVVKFKRLFGRLPSHLDGHKYYHLLPGNFSKVLEIAKKYSLPVRSVSRQDRKIIRESGIKTPDQFVSWHPARKNKLFRDIKDIKGGTTELLCHPGYFDLKAKTNYNQQREKELKILKGRQFEDLIQSFYLISYEQI